MLEDNVAPILVATDCLSEGVNLQNHFDAVVHYDLTWNPTRHEQREGRADRFGQASPTVRALMLYGENNPVDGAVLRVILRKAEKIRKELGVSVPLPADNNKVVDAIMRTVLLHGGSNTNVAQTRFDFGETEAQVDAAWETAKNRMTRTVFAQRRLTPDDVLPEWRKAVSVLGAANDVERFLFSAAQRLGAPLDARDGHFRLAVEHFPKPLQDRLSAFGMTRSVKISFRQPAPAGVTYVHRAHPLVSIFADHVTEQTLDTGISEIGARASAMFTLGVDTRTVLYLLRLRCHIQVEQRHPDGRYTSHKSLLAEECLAVAVRGDDTGKLLTEDDALSLLSTEPSRNMPDGQKSHFLREAIDSLSTMEETFDRIAREQATRLRDDHRRVREASDARGGAI